MVRGSGGGGQGRHAAQQTAGSPIEGRGAGGGFGCVRRAAAGRERERAAVERQRQWQRASGGGVGSGTRAPAEGAIVAALAFTTSTHCRGDALVADHGTLRNRLHYARRPGIAPGAAGAGGPGKACNGAKGACGERLREERRLRLHTQLLQVDTKPALARILTYPGALKYNPKP